MKPFSALTGETKQSRSLLNSQQMYALGKKEFWSSTKSLIFTFSPKFDAS